MSGPARLSAWAAVQAGFELAARTWSKCMLSLEDCLALCELSEDEVLAIAHHEHLPEIAAAELGNYLCRTPEGEMRIKAIIRDDIAEARAGGDRMRELALKMMLRNFILQHPGCEERHARQIPRGAQEWARLELSSAWRWPVLRRSRKTSIRQR